MSPFGSTIRVPPGRIGVAWFPAATWMGGSAPVPSHPSLRSPGRRRLRSDLSESAWGAPSAMTVPTSRTVIWSQSSKTKSSVMLDQHHGHSHRCQSSGTTRASSVISDGLRPAAGSSSAGSAWPSPRSSPGDFELPSLTTGKAFGPDVRPLR